MPRKPREPDSGNSVPTWIVSFSDMVTLLLAFFVLLQSFAHVQDPDLFFVGQGSYRRAISGMGIPAWLFGRKDRPAQKYIKIKHPTDEGTPAFPKERVIDADAEKLRKVFADLKEQFDTQLADVSQRTLRAEPTPIRFDGPRAELSDEAKAYLRQFATDLRQSAGPAGTLVYVVGLAADAADARQRLPLSARRAHAVEQFLDEALRPAGAGPRWNVFSWGAGAGDAWCRKLGVLAE
ncbi:MAG TPA: flagellar motor protein MotB, partial [Phycisphaerae bacterium]|nr:flagellar motor protein MotB [Phycisphaerae bacterium]